MYLACLIFTQGKVHRHVRSHSFVLPLFRTSNPAIDHIATPLGCVVISSRASSIGGQRYQKTCNKEFDQARRIDVGGRGKGVKKTREREKGKPPMGRKIHDMQEKIK